MITRRAKLGAGLFLVLAAVACGRVLEYPDPESERDAVLCADGEDNDFDGVADCADPDCTGFCAEETPTECSDGRDNDGDGLADAMDPRCWLHSAPTAERCAELGGIDFAENFEQGETLNTHGARWWSRGTWNTSSSIAAIANYQPHLSAMPAERQDLALSFSFNTTTSDVLVEDNLGSFVNELAFSGAWQGTEVSFSASVPPRSLLRAAIVPVDLAPIGSPPSPGAENALLAVTLDAAHTPAIFALDVERTRVSVALPSTRELCGGTTICRETLANVRVWFDGEAVRAKLTLPGGVERELRGGAPSSKTVSASRVVLWGGSTQTTTYALIDDLRVNVPRHWPCGHAVPQIPDTSCEFSGTLGAFGQRLSVARGSDGEYCALVSASTDSKAPPEKLTAWSSTDGANFTPATTLAAPPFSVPEDTKLVGVAIAAEEHGFGAALAYRGDGDVRLAFAHAERCDSWSDVTSGPALFADAEAPSLVIHGNERELYFTRPPTEVAPRTLWRLRSSSPERDPELLAELGSDVGAPVSVTRVGDEDLVLTYPNASGRSAAGIGVLVADASRRLWQEVGEGLELELPAPLERVEGRLAFDDRGVTAAALAWDPERAFFLYSASSIEGWYSQTETPVLAVGTARVSPAGTAPPDTSSTPDGRCGNERCDPDESCTSCKDDCPCSGVEIMSDPFSEGHGWLVDSLATDPTSIPYFFEGGLNVSGGEPTWSVLPLAQAIAGDFELAFDAELAFVYPDDRNYCALHLGLGAVPDLVPDPAVEPREARGVFARMRYSTFCGEKYALTPFIVNGSSKLTNYEESFDSFPTCHEAWFVPLDERIHVVLRREGSTVTLSVPRFDGCGMVEQTLTYAGAIESLPSLLVGFGGGPFENCAPFSGAARITNLELRLLDDPLVCPESKVLCASDGTEASCIDTQTSAENCGECWRACGANEACQGGSCGCSERPGILECDGACIDSLTSIKHCGACGNACAERCVEGVCDAIVGDCASPLPLASEGEVIELDFAHGEATVNHLCDQWVQGPIVVAWTPAISGTAIIEADVGDSELNTLLGVTQDSCCCKWYSCNDDALDLGFGSRAVMPVQAGQLYRIGVGIRGRVRGKVTLRVGFE